MRKHDYFWLVQCIYCSCSWPKTRKALNTESLPANSEEPINIMPACLKNVF